MKKLIMALMIIASPVVAQTISGITGAIDNGQSITISGSSFGTKSPAAPLKYDDFQSGVNGEVIAAGSPAWSWRGRRPTYSDGVAQYLPYTQGRVSAPYDTTFTVPQRFDGDMMCRQRFFYDAAVDSYRTQQHLDIAGLDIRKIYVFGHAKAHGSPTNATQGIRNFKLFQTNQEDWGNYDFVAYSLFPYDNDNAYIQVADCEDGPGDPCCWSGGCVGCASGVGFGNQTQWHAWEFYSDIGASDRNETMTVKRDNGNTATVTVPYSYEQWRCPTTRLYLSGYADQSVSENKAWLYWYWSEAYVDTTPARVMIGDASTLSACSSLEIQIPTAWSATSISVDVVTGSFDTDATAYLFVVDANGNASAGRQITIGDTTAESGLAPGNGGHFRHVDVLDFNRGWHYESNSANWASVADWLSDRLDVSEGELLIQDYDPDVKVFPYNLDLTVQQDNTSALLDGEECYLHWADETTIQHRDLSGNAIGSPTVYSAGARIQPYMWDSSRYMYNLKSSTMRSQQVARLLDVADDYNGIFLDEHNPGFGAGFYIAQNTIVSGGHVDEYDSLGVMDADVSGHTYNELDLAYQEDRETFGAQLKTAFDAVDKFILINPAQYGRRELSEDEQTAYGGVTHELTSYVDGLRGNDGYTAYYDQQQRHAANGVMVDLMGAWCIQTDLGTGGNYSTADQRYIMYTLLQYYMMRGMPDDPGIVYYNPNFCEQNRTVEDYEAEWPVAISYDVGDPVGDMELYYSEAEICYENSSHETGRNATAYVYSRRYTSGMVLVRPRDSWACGEWGDATAVTFGLPNQMQMLQEDGTLAEASSTVTLRNGEAIFLVGEVAGPPLIGPGTPTISTSSASWTHSYPRASLYNLDLSWTGHRLSYLATDSTATFTAGNPVTGTVSSLTTGGARNQTSGSGSN